MLFIDWRQLGLFLLAMLVLASCVAAISKMRKKHMLLRLASVLVSLPLGGIGALVVLVAILSGLLGCDTHGKAVYSPDRLTAARVESYDGGALGGASVVRLYSKYGLWTKTVFFGGWRSVEDSDLHWGGNDHLRIRYVPYRGYNEAGTCAGTSHVEVTCEARPDAP